MSESGTRSPKQAFYGYPIPKEGPDTGFTRKSSTNPVLRGTQLGIAAWAVSKYQTLARYLWNNAGFNELRQHEEFLHDIEPRYDPTVIPIKSATAAVANDSNSIEPDEYSPALLRKLETRLNELAIAGKYKDFNPRHYAVADYNTAYRLGILDPLAVAKAILNILRTSPTHKVAFVCSHETLVLAAAKASTARWKAGKPISVLDGVPVGVKDEVDLDQYQMHLGSKREFTRLKGGTAWCVRKWEEAGAVIVGKLNMHELGLDTTNLNTVTGTPVNPHNLNYYSGGSSGGSAHAVSSGILPITLGADGGGSIRIPASFCGVYGLKPTHGRVSAAPGANLAFSCGVIGPLASNMDDIEIAYRIMAAPDPAHPASSHFPLPLPPPRTPRTTPKVMGVFEPWMEAASSPVKRLCDAALSVYKAKGWTIIPISLPYAHLGQLSHTITILSEISASCPSLDLLSAPNKILLSVARQTPAPDFLLAQKVRAMLMQHLAHLWQKYPGMVIVSPTSPLPGWRIPDKDDLITGASDANISLRNMQYVWLANFTGCPALSVPVGMMEPRNARFPADPTDSEAEEPLGGRVPIGLMGMAEWGAEDDLLKWGRTAENWAWNEDGGNLQRGGIWVDVINAAKKM